MPVLPENRTLGAYHRLFVDPKRQLHEGATRDVICFVGAKLSKCHETAKFSDIFLSKKEAEPEKFHLFS